MVLEDELGFLLGVESLIAEAQQDDSEREDYACMGGDRGERDSLAGQGANESYCAD
jgi:hypothetical protein